MTQNRDDWRYVLCPLPVCRKEYDEDADEYRVVVGVCGADLHVKQETLEVLLAHGPAMDGGDCGPWWEVGCQNGHVLVVPDHGGDDDFHAIPLVWSMVREQLDTLSAEYRDV